MHGTWAACPRPGQRSRAPRFLPARRSRSRRSRQPESSGLQTLSLPENLGPVLEAVADVDEQVYLVGGTVRDILLGEPNFDVDIVVEGDAIPVAQALGEAL